MKDKKDISPLTEALINTAFRSFINSYAKVIDENKFQTKKENKHLIEIKVPYIGDFDEVGVIEILVKEGDTIEMEQSLVTVESDKASMEIPSSHAGVVKEIKVKLGDKVSQGSVVLLLEPIEIQNDSSKNDSPQTTSPDPSSLWADIDHRPCRLPKLEQTQLNDPEKGLWELWGQPADVLKAQKIVARNPALDIREQAVAIDFGTSSTVVAVDTPSGASKLLRIGVRDFRQAIAGEDFENPTVLECLDWPAFHEAWTATACRPALDWDWMRAAHEAQANWRDNPGDTAVLASILPRIKQWVLRQGQQQQQSWSDRQGHTIDLPQHTERNPVRGQWPQVSADDPFDPVELYAWYLGMAINWRGHGIYLKYFLSFPVKYALEVKNRILASFRRGLLRSLPATLLEAQPDVLHRFTVEELATEPAAYAAAALQHLNIQPTDAGVPYAVFDFGGGTSDFDFGLLRWANDEEDAQGYERVFEHLDSSGDNFLGGENLLEHLVYASFCHNLDALRPLGIQFVCPLDAQPFPGSEAFLAHTQAAQTNTIMLAAKLRPFLESDSAELPAQIKLDFIDSNHQKQACELVLDAQALDALLAQRIRRGVEAFLACLAQVQPDLPAGSEVQVLLAGNGCRSRHIRALVESESAAWQQMLAAAFGDTPPPAITIHAPLPIDPAQPYAPTAKTGVALGLLRVVPGKNALLMNRVHTAHGGQAPFGWFAGRMRRGQFQHQVQPDSPYGQWQALGPLQQGVFYLYTSASPRARSGLAEGDAELRLHALQFPAAPAGARLFARPARPGVLELACAADAAELEAEATPTLTTVQLAQ